MTWQFVLKNCLAPFVALIVGFVAAKINYNSSIIGLSRERLDKVYHPLFIAIEPFLYKEHLTIPQLKDFIDVYMEVEKHHSLLIYPSLRQRMKILLTQNGPFDTDKYGNNDWFLICDYVSKEYDKLCKMAHIPLRSVAYRLNYRQYKEKYQMYLGILYLHIPFMLFIIFTMLLLFLMTYV